MNRNETKLLVENWRKVLDEGLYDSDPELLEENLKNTIAVLGLVAVLTNAVLPKIGNAIPSPEKTTELILKSVGENPTLSGISKPGASTDIYKGNTIEDINNDVRNVLAVKELEKQAKKNDPNYKLSDADSEKIIDTLVDHVADGVADMNQERASGDKVVSGEMRGVWDIYGKSFSKYSKEKLKNIKLKYPKFFKKVIELKTGNPKLSVANKINNWSNAVKGAKSIDDVKKLSEKLTQQLEKESEKGNKYASEALKIFKSCGGVEYKKNEKTEQYKKRWSPIVEFNKSLFE